jgi:hypothetical protein
MTTAKEKLNQANEHIEEVEEENDFLVKTLTTSQMIAIGAIMVSVIGGSITLVYSIGNFVSNVSANAKGLDSNEQKIQILRQIHIGHSRKADLTFEKLQGDMGYIKGQLDILVKRTENK